MKKFVSLFAGVLVLFSSALYVSGCGGEEETTPPSGGSSGGGGGGGGTPPSPPNYVLVEPAVYVSPSGDDSNSGTNKTSPVKTIQIAVGIAISNGITNVYLKQGVYSNGSGLNSAVSGLEISGATNLTIVGGCNDDFSDVEGVSELKGGNVLASVVYILNSANINLDMVKVSGATNSGVVIDTSSNVNLKDGTAVVNNSGKEGGGVSVKKSYGVSIAGCVSNNTASSIGGGVYLYRTTNTTISGEVSHNLVEASDGGGIYINYSVGTLVSGKVVGNIASGSGGGIMCNYSENVTVSGEVNDNSTTNASGGGMYVVFSTNVSVSGKVSGNSAVLSGGGVCVSKSYIFETTSSSEVSGNLSKDGGGLGLFNSLSNVIAGTVSGNTATNSSGGIKFYYCTNSVVSGSVVGNVASNGAGGGINLNSSSNVIVSGKVLSNKTFTLSGHGGGVYSYMTPDVSFAPSAEVSFNSSQGLGGGIYLYDNDYASIECKIIGNSAGGGTSAICVQSSENVTVSSHIIGNLFGNDVVCRFNTVKSLNLLNSVISNNEGNQLVVLNSFDATNSGLVISNCVFSGAGSSSKAIYESVNDITGHTIVDNVFIAGTLGYIYWEEVSAGTTNISITNIDALNTSGDSRHDATTVGGNVTN